MTSALNKLNAFNNLVKNNQITLHLYNLEVRIISNGTTRTFCTIPKGRGHYALYSCTRKSCQI